MTEALGYRLDHVACGVHDLRTVPDLLVGTFGALPHDGGPGLGFTAGQWSFAGGGLLEVLEPAGAPGGFLHRFLERRGPGVHHVTFKVPDLASAAERARQRGYRWPESPLRIAVEIDPRAEEGPRCLEFVSAAPLELHEAPHPVLGVVLRVLTS